MKKQFLDDIVLFENEHVLVINKPPGISTLEDRKDDINVLSKVKELIPQIKNCHRLDKYTSGALLFAKNPDTYRSISLQFQNREVKKVYHAVVHGQTEFAEYQVNVPIIVKNTGIVHFDTRKGKESSTTFNTLKKYRTCSMVECRPLTGRKHQIRVHLKYCQHPIIGLVGAFRGRRVSDYGGQQIFLSQLKRKFNKSASEERPLISRMALHAYSLGFKLPDGKSLNVEAPYPKDFTILLKQLEKYG